MTNREYNKRIKRLFKKSQEFMRDLGTRYPDNSSCARKTAELWAFAASNKEEFETLLRMDAPNMSNVSGDNVRRLWALQSEIFRGVNPVFNILRVK